MDYKLLTVKDKETNAIICQKAMLADTFTKRFLGLMPFKSLEDDEGMLISPCDSIHMMFMKFPIDAVFITKNMNVCALYKNLKPWFGITKIVRDSESVLELKAGTIEKLNITIGSLLEIR